MQGLRTAPIAELFEFDFALDKLLILVGPVVRALTALAGKLYQAVLGHGYEYTP